MLLAQLVRLLQRMIHRIHIVAVIDPHNIPAITLKTLGCIVGKPVLYFAINRNAVVVIKNDEFGQAQRARKRTDFVRNAFHQTTITHKCVGVVVNNCVLGAVELSGQQGLGQRHAHGIGQTLAQRTRRRFNTWRDADFRVARRF